MTTSHTPEERSDLQGRTLLGSSMDQIWHKSAPSAIRKALARGDFAAVWDAWRKHLSARRQASDPNKVLPTGTASLVWGLPEHLQLPSPGSLAEQMTGQDAEQRVLGWLGEVAGGTPDIGYAIEAITLAWTLPHLAECISLDAWFALVTHLVDASGEARTVDSEHEPLLSQLLAGELPLTLACLFPELAPCRALSEDARRILAAGVVDVLDGEGLIHGNYVFLARAMLACWTRCHAIGRQMKHPCFAPSEQSQLGDMVRHAIRFARPDVGAMLGPSGQEGDADLLRAAVAMAGTAKDRALASPFLSPARHAKPKHDKSARRPRPATQSEWAATALLRSEWTPTSPRMAVVHAGCDVRFELGCGRDMLLCGTWALHVSRDGNQLAPKSDWEEICWVSDADIDYLELELELEGGVRVQRQIALAHDDRFLFLADAVLGDQPGKLAYHTCLPLAEGVEFSPAMESREGCLVGTKRRAMVFPLALAEWRTLWAAGELQATDSGLELTHEAKASRLYAPLFFDLDRHRFPRPFTWRRLTVAELLETQPDDVAVGYRMAIGKKQWLFYRSLDRVGNRTLLGHNLSTEALIAQFRSDGEVESLVEVE